MLRPTCASCPHWEARDSRTLALLPVGHPDRYEFVTGECHRSAPTGRMARHGSPLFVEGASYSYAWPPTDSFESCGEHPDFPGYLAARKGVAS